MSYKIDIKNSNVMNSAYTGIIVLFLGLPFLSIAFLYGKYTPSAEKMRELCLLTARRQLSQEGNYRILELHSSKSFQRMVIVTFADKNKPSRRAYCGISGLLNKEPTVNLSWIDFNIKSK